MPTTTEDQFSFDALHRAVGRPTAEELARMVGRSRRTIERWKAADAIPASSADHAAVGCQLHPANIWPDQW